MVARAGRTVRGGHRDREEPSVRTHEICDILARNSVPFGFYRSDSAEGRQALARLGVDRPAGPVVALFNGIVLVDPGNAEVAEALGVDVRPARSAYDLIIVGAGPAGLAAAVYAASEGLATVLLELEAFGGQAGTSSRIRNYLGFPRGISGADLAWRAYEQAWTFGTHLLIQDRDSGRTESVPAAGLFILIGAEPFTGWLPGAIARDQWGFIVTGPDAAPRWPLPRAPFPFETTAPGVFAVGDVRHGSVKRVASAVGEGSIAVRLVHDYLALALQAT